MKHSLFAPNPFAPNLFAPSLFASELFAPSPLLFALSLVAATAALATGAKAQDYPWCANYTKGSTSCSFVTFEQCMTDVSGIGGFCERNWQYHPATAPVRQKPRTLSKSN